MRWAAWIVVTAGVYGFSDTLADQIYEFEHSALFLDYKLHHEGFRIAPDRPYCEIAYHSTSGPVQFRTMVTIFRFKITGRSLWIPRQVNGQPNGNRDVRADVFNRFFAGLKLSVGKDEKAREYFSSVDGSSAEAKATWMETSNSIYYLNEFIMFKPEEFGTFVLYGNHRTRLPDPTGDFVRDLKNIHNLQ